MQFEIPREFVSIHFNAFEFLKNTNERNENNLMKIARKKPKWELDGSNIITIIKTFCCYCCCSK